MDILEQLQSILSQHPQQVCMTYWEHCQFSLKMSYYLGLGSVKAIIHAFLPNYCTTSTTETAKLIQDQLSTSGCRKSEGQKQEKSFSSTASQTTKEE